MRVEVNLKYKLKPACWGSKCYYSLRYWSIKEITYFIHFWKWNINYGSQISFQCVDIKVFIASLVLNFNQYFGNYMWLSKEMLMEYFLQCPLIAGLIWKASHQWQKLGSKICLFKCLYRIRHITPGKCDLTYSCVYCCLAYFLTISQHLTF